jgi:DNA polymerase III subunit gamma/tau
MSYLVLARKWRPQAFEEVVGQGHITRTLQNAISQRRIAHAFLFTGARGVGKTSTARILAKALNCEKGPEINPCNQCTTCKEISSGNSVDVIEIDGASNRGIDEIRELRENVRYAPAKNRYKIYIIDEVHMLTREAFNALLKTLEEPPPHIIFIFATTEPHKIPATILSRCQRYDFKRIPLKEIVGNLKKIIVEEKVQISQRALLAIAQESEGSLRDAQSLLDQLISYAGEEIRDEDMNEVLGLIDRRLLSDTIEAIASRDVGRCMEVVEHIYQYGADLQHFCRELLQYFRNLILMKVSQHPEALMELPEEELDILRGQAEKFEFDQLNHLFNLLLQGEEEIAQSTFPRTMLEITLIRMAALKSILPIEDILKKLEGLEKRNPSSGSTERKEPFSSDRTMGSRDSQKERGEEGKSQLDRGEIQKERLTEARIPSKGLTYSSGHARPEFESQASPDFESEIGVRHSGQPLPTAGRLNKSRASGRGVEGLSEGMKAPSAEAMTPLEDSKEELEAGGVSQEIREETWTGLVDYTRARNPILGSFLAMGDLITISEEMVEIGFEKDSFHYERILEKENRSQLESICHEYLKRKARVVISPMDQKMVLKGRGGGEIGRSLRRELEKQETIEGGEEHPLIEEALRLFDGRIVKR